MRAGREALPVARPQDSDAMPAKNPGIVPYLLTASDMVGFVAELPFRWKRMSLKKELPLPTKIGYGLMLNAVTDMWLVTSGVGRKRMDFNALIVVKHYIGYMNTMDDYLDETENKPSVMRFRKGDELWERRKALFGSIGQYDMPLQKGLKRVITVSAFSMMQAIVRSRARGISTLDDALYLREMTAGEICKSTAEIYNLINSVPPDRARSIEEAYWNVGMVLQVHDDVGDIVKDDKEGHPENLVLQILNRRPDEKARLMEALGGGKKKCTFSRIVKHAPETAREALALQDHYMAAIPDAGGFERIKCLLDLTVSMRGRSAAFRSVIDQMDL